MDRAATGRRKAVGSGMDAEMPDDPDPVSLERGKSFFGRIKKGEFNTSERTFCPIRAYIDSVSIFEREVCDDP
jgi:hypothetical protein